MRTAIYSFFALFLSASPVFGNIIYVNQTAPGANDGNSWQDAYHNLQNALAEAISGDTIWVAEGTYFPTQSSDRNIYFELKNGVRLLGGFAGTETQLSQRDWASHPTILSGDIGMSGDSTDNSYTILYIGTSDTTTLVDGLTLAFGNANGQAVFDRNPLRAGGGLYVMGENSYAYPRIWNCRFEYNYALKLGGAAYVNGVNGSVAPQFFNCVFESNHAGVDGGAIRRDGGSWVEVRNDFWNCSFVNNSAGQNGGAILYRDTERLDTTEYVGCVFLQNHAGNLGGAVCQLEGRATGTKVIVTNCNFHENEAEIGGGYYFYTFSLSFSDFFRFIDCIFSKNHSLTFSSACHIDALFLDDSFINTFFDHCIFEMNANINSNNTTEGTLNQSALFGRTVISNCSFIGNISKNIITLSLDGSNQNSIIDRCVFKDNSNNGSVFETSNLVETGRVPLIFSNNKCVDNELLEGSVINTLNTNTFTQQVVNCTFHNNNIIPSTTSPSGNFSISNTIITGESLSPTTFPFNGANMEINHSLLSASGCGSLPPNLTCGPNMLYNLDPLFRDTAAGDYRLLPCSPARNAGSNAIVDSLGILTDIEGSPRIQGGTVDMGAYESPAFGASDVAVTVPACGSSGLGTVSLNLAYGCPPYFLDWGTGSTISDTLSVSLDLPVGTHAITITDGRMESDTVSVTVTAVPAIAATAVAQPVNCASGTGGSASVEATGGTGGFGFAWSSGGTTASVTGLAEGTYTVTVTDASGCTAVDTVEVLAQGSLGLGLSIQPVTCPGDTDGSATVQPIGGAMPFQWLWQSGETTASIQNLSGGTYAATVTDALGCTGDIDFTIEPLETISIDIASTGANCFGGLGNATATATGGTGSFHYDWDTGAATAAAPMPAGPHSVTATDANGCTATATTEVTEPPALSASATPQPPALCHGASDGSIAVSPSGGTPPYGWGGPLEALPPGTYTATVTDANGCTATASATLGELPEIAATGAVTDASGPSVLDGSIMLNSVTGGTGSGYAFLWSNGGTSQNLTGIPTGSYTVTVTDSQGCIGVFSFHVDFETATGEAAPDPFGAAIVPNPSGSTGAVLVVNRPSNDMRFTVLDALGRTVVAEQNLSAGAHVLPPGLAPGTYFVVLKSADGRAVLKWAVAE